MTASELKRYFGFAAVCALTVLLALTIYTVRYILLAALIGVGLGVLLSPLIRLLHSRFRIPYGVSAILLVLFIFAAFGGAGYGIFALASQQIDNLTDRAPIIFETARDRISDVLNRAPWLEKRVRGFDFAGASQAAFGTIFTGLQTTAAAIVGTLVVITMSLYTALHSAKYLSGFLSLFPEYLRPRAREIMTASANVLRKWFRAQLVVMSISGVATMIGLWIIGIEFWLVLGLLTAVFSFIPFVGAFLTGGLTILVTLGSDPEKVWWVLGLYFLIQQLEGDVTMPLVMKGGVRLPELHLVVLMLVMGQLFGLLGVFLAPPLLAVGRCIYMMTYVPRMDRAKRPAPKQEPRPT